MIDTVKDDFLKLWEFFAWMDKARWGESAFRSVEQKIRRFNKVQKEYGIDVRWEDLKPNDIILAHWLTYIFDYAMPTESVWNKAFPIMAYISYRYRNGTSLKTIKKEHIEYVKTIGKSNPKFYIKGSKKELSFKHRFGAAHHLDQVVERTLEGLKEHNRDLVFFMFKKSRGSPSSKWIKDTASALYDLTYKPGEKLAWDKRTWSAFRDYLKCPPCKNYVLESAKEYREKFPSEVLEKWRKPEPYLDQLELPGDVWNKRFYEKILKEYIKPLTGKEYANPSQGIREAYNVLKDEARERGLYPEQFDVTYDFASLCEDERCYMCPLGSYNIDKLCIGNLRNARQKYCPLLLAICGYLAMCNPDNCPVFNKRTQGLCKHETSTYSRNFINS